MSDNKNLTYRLKFFTTIIFGLVFNLTQFAQTNGSNNQNVEASFPGGSEAIYKIIADNLQYPISAKKNRIGGKVTVSFTVDTLGMVTQIKIAQGINPDIDNEALRLVGLLNGWTPGIYKGEKRNFLYTLPILFFPDEKFKKKYKKDNPE